MFEKENFTVQLTDPHAVVENLNIVDALDHIFAEEAKSKRKRAYEKQIQMSGFPIKKKEHQNISAAGQSVLRLLPPCYAENREEKADLSLPEHKGRHIYCLPWFGDCRGRIRGYVV